MLERRLEASQRDDVNPDKTVLVRIPRRRAFVLRGEWDVLNENDVWVLLAITSKIGKKVRFHFYATAENYQAEKEFCFEVEVLPSVPGQIVTPATVKDCT